MITTKYKKKNINNFKFNFNFGELNYKMHEKMNLCERNQTAMTWRVSCFIHAQIRLTDIQSNLRIL